MLDEAEDIPVQGFFWVEDGLLVDVIIVPIQGPSCETFNWPDTTRTGGKSFAIDDE